MWALQRLRKLLTTEYGQSININRLLGDSEGEARSMVSKRGELNYLLRVYVMMIYGIISAEVHSGSRSLLLFILFVFIHFNVNFRCFKSA